MTGPVSALGSALIVVGMSSAPHAQAQPPTNVAGIAIPRTPLASSAEKYVRDAEPEFLVNHSIRTFLFGALSMKARQTAFDPETAYVAALFHDLGLVRSMASEAGSFETDGANKAEEFVRANGGTVEQARVVWNAVVMHDMGRLYQSHQSGEALLVGAGARADVNGADPKEIPAETVELVLQAFPRLQFKERFTAAAVDHCRRKPASQIGWLDVLCRDAAPKTDRGSVQESIAAAPFSE